MTTYIAFLRGINVGAHNRMKMDAFRALCESLGVEHVRTYIQSGNVVFDAAETDPRALEADLESAILDEFDYDITVMVRTLAELDRIVEGQPFEESTEHTKRYVTFLEHAPEAEQVESLVAASEDAETFVVVGREVYSELRADELASGSFTDAGAKLGTAATRRNWNVVTAVLELASG